MKLTFTRAVAVLCSMLLVEPTPIVFAQQPAASGASAQAQSAGLLSQEQLDSLVAPIALYPDPILSQVLVASTYPLEIVQAARWYAQNSTLKGTQLTDAAAKQDWDASVQALVAFPDLLKKLNQDISWTSDLGNAFLAQQDGVMGAVQRMRQKAQSNGVLKSTPQQTVATTTQGDQSYVTIQPADPQVVYIPEYNPVAVWGPPPVYYPYPPIYYPPSTGAVFAAGAISFGAGIAMGALWSGGWGGWGGWGWRSGWGGNNVIINNNFIRNNHFNRVNVGNGNRWVHNPAHRGGVPYNNRNVSNRFNGNRPNAATRPSVAQTQQRLNQAGVNRGNMGRPNQNPAARPGGNAFRPGQGATPGRANAVRPGQGNIAQQRPAAANRAAAANRVGNRNIGGAAGMNRAFGGGNVGGNRARMNMNRGAMSRGGGMRGGGGMRRGGGGRRR